MSLAIIADSVAAGRMEAADRFTVTGSGHTPARIRASDLNLKTLSSYFGMVPESIVLVSGRSGNMEIPDSDGFFPSYRMDKGDSWRCQGSSFYRPGATPAAAGSYRKRKAQSAAVSAVVGHRPSPSFLGPEKRKRPTCVDVDVCAVQDSKKGKKKKTVQPVSSLRVEVSDENATVKGVSRAISEEAFGGQPVVLLNTKNLAVLDCPATRSECIMYFQWLSLMCTTLGVIDAR